MASNTYSFFIGGSVSQDFENIKEIIECFNYFKKEFGKNKTICNMIQEGISLWNDKLEPVIENSEKFFK